MRQKKKITPDRIQGDFRSCELDTSRDMQNNCDGQNHDKQTSQKHDFNRPDKQIIQNVTHSCLRSFRCSQKILFINGLVYRIKSCDTGMLCGLSAESGAADCLRMRSVRIPFRPVDQSKLFAVRFLSVHLFNQPAQRNSGLDGHRIHLFPKSAGGKKQRYRADGKYAEKCDGQQSGGRDADEYKRQKNNGHQNLCHTPRRFYSEPEQFPEYRNQ